MIRRIGKIFAQVVCGFIHNKTLRRKVRWALDPCSPPHLINYFSKRYLPKVKLGDCFCDGEKSDYIFQCWLQGVENAPPLVKKCIASVEKFKGNRKHIVITNENLNEWVRLPSFVWEKYKSGKIGNAHFADIIRLYLLAEYGGYWIDATCFMTAEIPEVVDSEPLFMYHSSGRWDWTLVNNCFIHADKGNSLILAWRDIMIEYWKGENRALEYFFCHLCFRTLLLNSLLKSGYDNMPFVLQDDTHKLAGCFALEMDDTEIEKILHSSFIHKLSYKLNVDFGNSQLVASKFMKL